MPFSSPVIDGLSLSKPSYFVDLCDCWNDSFFSPFQQIRITSVDQLSNLLSQAYESNLSSENDYVLKARSFFNMSDTFEFNSMQSLVTHLF